MGRVNIGLSGISFVSSFVQNPIFSVAKQISQRKPSSKIVRLDFQLDSPPVPSTLSRNPNSKMGIQKEKTWHYIIISSLTHTFPLHRPPKLAVFDAELNSAPSPSGLCNNASCISNPDRQYIEIIRKISISCI
jgi:hypothetical protein